MIQTCVCATVCVCHGVCLCVVKIREYRGWTVWKTRSDKKSQQEKYSETGDIGEDLDYVVNVTEDLHLLFIMNRYNER
jgi:hypothetical protein